ncbi:winged helix-turn-helix transcriptional regulator [Enterococcus faecium]|uniref:Uncharacterized protein n=1 Tax=Enterococcus faecium TaxID=1352 RepID=A0A242BGA2_ENTFC|nr:hypothetical protein [Enterococcus faecium]OTN94525.1 hypothetical protein A5810_000768 [Enterococcus faecium]
MNIKTIPFSELQSELKELLKQVYFITSQGEIVMNQQEFNQKIQLFKDKMPKKYPIIYFDSMKIIGSKWKNPVIWHLMLTGGQHYNELKLSIENITKQC